MENINIVKNLKKNIELDSISTIRKTYNNITIMENDKNNEYIGFTYYSLTGQLCFEAVKKTDIVSFSVKKAVK